MFNFFRAFVFAILATARIAAAANAALQDVPRNAAVQALSGGGIVATLGAGVSAVAGRSRGCDPRIFVFEVHVCNDDQVLYHEIIRVRASELAHYESVARDLLMRDFRRRRPGLEIRIRLIRIE